MERASTLLSTPTMGSPADFDQLSQQATLPSGNLASFVSSKQLFQHLLGFSYIGLACSLWPLQCTGQRSLWTLGSVHSGQCPQWALSSVQDHQNTAKHGFLRLLPVCLCILLSVHPYSICLQAQVRAASAHQNMANHDFRLSLPLTVWVHPPPIPSPPPSYKLPEPAPTMHCSELKAGAPPPPTNILVY